MAQEGARQVRSSTNDGPSTQDQSRSEAPMSDYNSDALTALQGELKTKVVMRPLLIDMLAIPAGGFMTRAEASSVQNAESPMGELITILLGKGDNEFDIFCDMLRKSNHCAWAVKLKQKAESLRTGDQKKDSATTDATPIVAGIKADYMKIKRTLVRVCTAQKSPTLEEVKGLCLDLLECVFQKIPRMSGHANEIREATTMEDIMRIVCFRLSNWLSYDFLKTVIAEFQPSLQSIADKLACYESKLEPLLLQKLEDIKELQQKQEVPQTMAELIVKYRLDADGLAVNDLITERDFLAQRLCIPPHLLQVLSWGPGSVSITYWIVRNVLPLAELALCRTNVRAELIKHGVEAVYLDGCPLLPGPVDHSRQSVHLQRRAIVAVIDAHHKDLDVNLLASDLIDMGIFTTEQCQWLTSLDEKDRRHEALLYSLLAHEEPDMYHRLVKCIGQRNASIAADLQATFLDLMKPPGALSVDSSQSTYLMMDKTKRKALRRCHQELRTHIIVNDFLPSLHVDADGFLKDLESGRIRKYTGNIEQVDELIDILVTKENKDFDHFCVVLEKEGYHVWSEKLMEAAGLTSRTWLLKELSCTEEELLREALKQAKAILSTRLPIEFLPTVLVSKNVISSQECQYIKGERNNVDKSTMLLEMMERKSISDIQNFLEILKSDDFCGYGYLAEMVESDFDALVKKKKADGQSTQPASGRKTQPASQEVDDAVGSKRSHSAPVHSAQEHAQEGKIMNFDSTINLPPMPVELQVISSVLLKDKVYITGFTDMVPSEDDTSLQVQVYSLEKAKWSTLPRATIYNASIVVIDGRITLIGGRSVKTKKITDVQATWFEEEGQWKESRMNTRRLETGVCQYDSLLLVTGGVMDAAEEGKTTVVNTVDVYNCSTKTWTTPQALELPVKLRSHHLVVFEEYIYVMGGSFVYPISRKSGEKQFNGKAWRAQWSDVKKAVKQSSKAKTKVKSLWMPIVAPPVLRPTVVVYKGFLLSIGGVLGGEPQKGIYMFVDGKADSHWMKVGELNMGRYRHGVVPGPVESRGITLFVVGGYMQSSPEGEDTVRTSSAQIASASASLAQIESASTCIVCLLITVHVHCGYVFL